MRFAFLMITLTVICTDSAFAFKAKEPSPQESARLIAMAKNRKTDDGASVIEVLRYAEKLRKGKFKLAGDFELNYRGDGNLSGVGICYWIGAKKLPGDAFCDIGYDISQDRKSITPSVGILKRNEQENMTVIQLERGRDAFLKKVDELYKSDCLDAITKKKIC